MLRWSISFRILIGLLVALGFAIPLVGQTYSIPRAYDGFLTAKASGIVQGPWVDVLQGSVPQYPLGYSGILLTIPLFLTILALPNITRALSPFDRLLSRFSPVIDGVAVMLVYGIFALPVWAFNFHFSIFYAFMALCYGFAAALITAIVQADNDLHMSGSSEDDMSEDVLDMQHRKWITIMQIIAVSAFGVAVAAAFQMPSDSWPNRIGEEATRVIQGSTTIQGGIALIVTTIVTLGTAYWKLQRIEGISRKLHVSKATDQATSKALDSSSYPNEQS